MISPRRQIERFQRLWVATRSRHPRLIRNVLFGTLAAVVCLAAFSVWFIASLVRGLPDKDALDRIGEMDQATAVFDRDDKLAFTIFKEQRTEVPLNAISPVLIKAILAIEDQRFYQHSGFDVIRIVSAALANVRSLQASQGGSTITQQLARQSFLTTDKTFRRKIQEVILARRIENSYSKPQILELYLNKIYFGDGLHGIEAAARGYFGKHASEVSLEQAALLAGLVKSPSSYAPTVSPARAKNRRNLVLNAMLEHGDIDKAAWQAARSAPVALHDDLRDDEPHGQYFKEQVRRQLVERFGWERVYEGGLRVFSTIDLEMQQAAEDAVTEGLKAVEARQRTAAARRTADKPDPAEVTAPLQAAVVAMDPSNGHVRVMIGGRDFKESSFNRAVQAERQPGSAFKPFVYAAALEAGYTPASVIENLNAPIETPEGGWSPEDEHSDADSMSLRAALRTSSNRAAVRLLEEVGIPRTVQYAKSLGVGNVPSVPSLALGSGEVTLQSLTAAYAAFANRGQVPRPLLIRRVEDKDGRVLFEQPEESSRAISEQTAFLMATMMADVINAGTGARARALGFKLPAAGKTGTTNEYRDAWFVGFTPSLVSGVWVGYDQPRTIIRGGFAAEVAVPIWAHFMKEATRGDKPRWLSAPSGITTASVCRISGKLATGGCEDVEVVEENGKLTHRSMVYTEYFVNGTQPTTSCELHQKRGFLGALASAFGAGHEAPAPPTAAETGLPAETADAALPSRPVVQPEPPAKKRGFWSRLFGRGKDKDKDDDKK
jgi:1A family penicillin-binding protein